MVILDAVASSLIPFHAGDDGARKAA